MKADGTVQLPAASAIFGTGSTSALSIWSLAGSAVSVKHGGQVETCAWHPRNALQQRLHPLGCVPHLAALPPCMLLCRGRLTPCLTCRELMCEDGLVHMAAPLQVTWYQTPDRAVLSFVNISDGAEGQSSWQVGAPFPFVSPCSSRLSCLKQAGPSCCSADVHSQA